MVVIYVKVTLRANMNEINVRTIYRTYKSRFMEHISEILQLSMACQIIVHTFTEFHAKKIHV